jgi:predicted transcriptional regulator
MNDETRTIEIDAATADALEARAAARGVSIREVVAELVAFDDGAVVPDADEMAELDRQWAAIQAGEATVPHEQVARWLETWGTPEFKPWHER